MAFETAVFEGGLGDAVTGGEHVLEAVGVLWGYRCESVMIAAGDKDGLGCRYQAFLKMVSLEFREDSGGLHMCAEEELFVGKAKIDSEVVWSVPRNPHNQKTGRCIAASGNQSKAVFFHVPANEILIICNVERGIFMEALTECIIE